MALGALPGLRRVPRAIIHIGTEKTGTTSIQAMLAEAGAHLLEHEVWLPHTGRVRPGLANHVLLAASCIGDSPTAASLLEQMGLGRSVSTEGLGSQLLEELGRELSSLGRVPRTVLLSTEHAQSRLRSADDVDALRILLEAIADEVTVVVYLRPQHQVALSVLSTFLKGGETRSPTHIDALWARPVFGGSNEIPVPSDEVESAVADYFDYSQLLEKWSAVFGEHRIVVRRYLPDVRADFLRTIALLTEADLGPVQLDVDALRRNTSLSIAQMRRLLALNLALELVPSGIAPIARAALLADEPGSVEDTHLLLSQSGAAAITARFDSSNEAVRKRFLPDLERLFEPDLDRHPEVAAELTPDFDISVERAIASALRHSS